MGAWDLGEGGGQELAGCLTDCRRGQGDMETRCVCCRGVTGLCLWSDHRPTFRHTDALRIAGLLVFVVLLRVTRLRQAVNVAPPGSMDRHNRRVAVLEVCR